MARTKTGDSGTIGGGGATAPSKPAPPSAKPGPTRETKNGVNYDYNPKPISGPDMGGSGSSGQGGGGFDPGPKRTSTNTAKPARAGGIDLRQIFTGATLRNIIGLPQKMADVVLGRIKHPDGGQVYAIAKDRSDVYIAFQDILSNIFGIGRLFAPANALWRLPQSGQSCMVLKPSEADGTGVPYVLYGDGGTKQAVPAWLDTQNSGTFVIENWNIDAGGTVRIRSAAKADGTQDANKGATVYLKPDGTLAISAGQGVNVTIDATSGGNVVVNGGNLAVARNTDAVKTFIPTGAVIVSVSSGVGTSNAAPIPCTGTIQAGAPNFNA